MKLHLHLSVESGKRFLFFVAGCILAASVYAKRPTQLHCLGNGSYCAFGQGADIESIFGPGYSSPSYLQMTVHGVDSTCSIRMPGTAIWEHTLYKGGEVIARFTDFIDSESAIYTRMVDCRAAFTMDIHVVEDDKITLANGWYDDSSKHSSSLLIYKDRGLSIYGNYDHPYEQFQHIYTKGNIGLKQKEQYIYTLSFGPGESELYCIGGSSFQECEENSRLATTCTA